MGFSAEQIATALQRDNEANAWLLRGLALLDENTPGSLRESLGCFEKAIHLRSQLPIQDNSWFRYGLIAGWLNRGEALTRLGSAAELREALDCYDEALRHARELPLAESPLFVKRLAIAWLNRGVTLLAQAAPGDVVAAVPCFDEAIAAAQTFFATAPNEERTLLASAWANRGIALIRLEPPQADPARQAARQALSLCGASQAENAAAASVAFRARHVWCQALAQLLTEPAEQGRRESLLTEATDAVDEVRLVLSRPRDTVRALDLV